VVYNGLYEPGHPLADEQGFRKDVIAAVREAGITGVRYPGGNFVSGYRWTDGIGPRAERKRRLNLAWRTVETNEIGTDEFADWCRKAGVELQLTANLGTGSPQEAGELVEYCNHPAGTYWSDLRRANGHADPHNVRLWYLGNEMDGEWQIGRLSPEEYGARALETAKIVKWVDPTAEVVACGSCCTEIPTYPDWDRIVLEQAYDKIDYLSLHRYYSYDPAHHLFYPTIEDPSDIAYFPADLQDFLHTVISAADFVKAKLRSRKTVNISFDEWNVVSDTNVAFTPQAPWQTSTDAGEERFTLRDALIYGGLLCTFLKNADRVKIACQSLLVNVGGMFYTRKGGGLVHNPVFTPFQQAAAYAKGTSLLDRVTCPMVHTNHYGELPAIQSAAVYDEENGALTVFLSNFDAEDDCEMTMDLRSFPGLRMVAHSVLDGDLDSSNTDAEPEKVASHSNPLGLVSGGRVDVVIPKSSWNVLRFSTRPQV
jgi:alpha-N-arabinofuranosidase